jgi:hypothetical protein
MHYVPRVTDTRVRTGTSDVDGLNILFRGVRRVIAAR